ncbi:hypothetical protein NA56DRAFT_440544 [Hyaloscypha hepaticicola]|uniref:Uncharacterized protein n=1 Tax=Hyaloscypha hepaticicola TaxID=2082293 RepID=A0A2J6PGY8_9HELO|nr:hypothetical protein NA56DRAFT_440544 [Hyaloscypha hepaticicola]
MVINASPCGRTSPFFGLKMTYRLGIGWAISRILDLTVQRAETRLKAPRRSLVILVTCLGPLSLSSSRVTEVPHQSTLRTKTRLNAFHHHNKMRDIYTKTLRIDKAMAAIQRGEFIHYTNITKYYKCSRNAVSWRMRALINIGIKGGSTCTARDDISIPT